MAEQDDDRRSSPRERARLYLERMLRTAVVTAASCTGDVADPVPEPTSSDSGRDTGTGGSTTWDDPCAEDGCDPVPPPETSTGPTTGTDGADSGSGTGAGSTGADTDAGTTDAGTTGTGSTGG